VLSSVVMSILYKSGRDKFSITGISIAGAVSHNVGQIFVAAVFMKDLAVAVVLPVLLVSGCIMGFFVGLVSSFLEGVLRKTRIFD